MSDFRWSLSKLKTAEQCLAKYDYRYNQKLPEGETSYAAARGQDLHAQIERFLKKESDQLPDSLAIYAPWLRQLVDTGALAEYEILLNRAWQSVKGTDVPPWYKGILDLLYVQPPIAHIYDWKSGKIYPDHADQAEIYALVTMKALSLEGALVRHVYLDQGKTIERVYGAADIPRLEEKWKGKADRLENTTEFPPNPNYGCRYCPYSRYKSGPCRF